MAGKTFICKDGPDISCEIGHSDGMASEKDRACALSDDGCSHPNKLIRADPVKRGLRGNKLLCESLSKGSVSTLKLRCKGPEIVRQFFGNILMGQSKLNVRLDEIEFVADIIASTGKAETIHFVVP